MDSSAPNAVVVAMQVNVGEEQVNIGNDENVHVDVGNDGNCKGGNPNPLVTSRGHFHLWGSGRRVAPIKFFMILAQILAQISAQIPQILTQI